MKKQVLFFASTILILLLSSCENEPLKSGINSTVFGVVKQYNNEPIANQKFIVREYKDKFVSDGGSTLEYIGDLGEGTTDQDGIYNINFTTSGKGNVYKLAPVHNNLIWTYQIDPVLIEKIGGSNELNFNFLKLYPCILNITLNNINYLPLFVSNFLTLTSENETITENNTTVVRKLYISKTVSTEVIISRNTTPTSGESAIFIIPNTLPLPTSFDINLNNSDFQ